MVVPTDDKGPEFIDLCTICKQGIVRGSLIFADGKSYHSSCYAAFGQRAGTVKPA